jgi:uncharacterized lipoprotein YmbA
MRPSLQHSIGVAIAAACALVACSSSKLPERFHTLLPAAHSVPAGAPMHPIYIDVLPVSVPAQVDHAQWVVRQSDDSLLVLEQDRWAAPLQDELRGAIVLRLTSAWGAVDVRGVALPAAPLWRVRVDVQRFESIAGREARIEATWSLSSTQRGAPTLVCRGAWIESVALASVSALAQAHQRAVVRLSDAVGARLKALQAGQSAGCE